LRSTSPSPAKAEKAARKLSPRGEKPKKAAEADQKKKPAGGKEERPSETNRRSLLRGRRCAGREGRPVPRQRREKNLKRAREKFLCWEVHAPSK